MNKLLSYLITDPKFYTDNPTKLKKFLEIAVNKHKVDMICFRDKKSKNFKSLSIHFLKKSKNLKISKILINSNIDIAYRYKFDGVHLPSSKMNLIKQAKRKKLFVIASTHNFYEIKKAIDLGADMITYSPIFYTPNKGEPKGLKNLRKVVLKSKIPVIALGGIITKEQINKIKIRKAAGFASIRYFVNKYW
ncbi:thiamine phosphate synthase [Nitrosophilus kaiyonis]|uniref:thiamine phosphate synthase n=1 Tax=Nitrosophilus kaiyonis TaxID=2930200 RepID=UPI00248FD23D|nr:thiamine phosphate synthase [Nitrosophilus kaiyonis]